MSIIVGSDIAQQLYFSKENILSLTIFYCCTQLYFFAGKVTRSCFWFQNFDFLSPKGVCSLFR